MHQAGHEAASADTEAPQTQAPPARGFVRLEVVVFVVGAASLGAEIAATRLIAPYFGASTIVWANTIATVLLSLSAGYAVGGRVADRAPHMRGLCALCLAAAALLAAVPVAAQPLLSAGVPALDRLAAGAAIGSLAAVLVLVAVPILLLGAITPYAVRLRLERIDSSGRTSGRLYAISTLGSLVGTFAAALVLVPLVGTRRTFIIFALLVACVAALGLSRRFLLVPLVIACLLAIPTGTVKASAPDGRVIFETDTPYQYARVIQTPAGVRRLELNEGLATHSLLVPNSFLTGDYWDDFLVDGRAVQPSTPRRIAILGNAAGTTARAVGHYFPSTDVDAVEIDGELTAIGHRFFDLQGPHLNTISADARPFLQATTQRYDQIFIDAYRQPYIPFYLTTREFFGVVASHLEPGGAVVINVGHPEASNQLERVLTATMRTAFASVSRDPVTATNTLLVGSQAAISPGLLTRSADLGPELLPIAQAAAARLSPGFRGGEVYTDDRAPIEWLVDRSIIRYAARQGH